MNISDRLREIAATLNTLANEIDRLESQRAFDALGWAEEPFPRITGCEREAINERIKKLGLRVIK